MCYLSIPSITLPEAVYNTVMNTTKQRKLLQIFLTQFPMHRLLKLASPTPDVLQACEKIKNFQYTKRFFSIACFSNYEILRVL